MNIYPTEALGIYKFGANYCFKCCPDEWADDYYIIRAHSLTKPLICSKCGKVLYDQEQVDYMLDILEDVPEGGNMEPPIVIYHNGKLNPYVIEHYNRTQGDES